MSKEIATITDKELSLVENSALTAKQASFILKKTPEIFIKERPAKGGGKWKYVTGGYVKKCLNLMFGFDWDFEILENQVIFGEVIVKGRLTVRTNGKTIVKTQFGNKDIVYKKELVGGERMPLSIGNDLKAASTDALKKCAAEIGIASDIYNAEEFKEVNVIDSGDTLTQINELFNLHADKLKEADFQYIQNVISEKKTRDYAKALNILKFI